MSTLLPYTTLSRSGRRLGVGRSGARPSAFSFGSPKPVSPAVGRQPRLVVDRKSTRPNSSNADVYPLALHDALPIWSTTRRRTIRGEAVGLFVRIAEAGQSGRGSATKVGCGDAWQGPEGRCVGRVPPVVVPDACVQGHDPGLERAQCVFGQWAWPIHLGAIAGSGRYQDGRTLA